MSIDLHTHSTASDGTLTPGEIVVAAAAAGLSVVGLTDHDTTAGWAEAADQCPSGLTLIRGAEFSCRWYGADPPISLHMLGYLFDSEHPELVSELARVRQSRLVRGQAILDLLRADGIDIQWAEVLDDAGGGTVGRPHIARALVRRGLVETVTAAFADEWLGQRYRLPKQDLDVFRAVALIRDAGGVAVFAHPKAAKRGRVVPDEVIVELAEHGLAGLEVDHTDHDAQSRARLRELAADLGLIVTGSSDFHGANKTVRLGEHTTDPQALEQIIAAAKGCQPILGRR